MIAWVMSGHGSYVPKDFPSILGTTSMCRNITSRVTFWLKGYTKCFYKVEPNISLPKIHPSIERSTGKSPSPQDSHLHMETLLQRLTFPSETPHLIHSHPANMPHMRGSDEEHISHFPLLLIFQGNMVHHPMNLTIGCKRWNKHTYMDHQMDTRFPPKRLQITN